MATARLTHSQRSSFLFCPRQFFYRYEQHLELRSQRPGRRRGSIFGNALQVAREQYDNLQSVPEEERPEEDSMFDPVSCAMLAIDVEYEKLGDAAHGQGDVDSLELEQSKVRVMVQEYLRRYGYRARREVEYTLPFRNPASGGYSKSWRIAGKMDGLEVIKPGHARLVEDKFVGQIQQPMIDRLPLDSQTTEYVQALAAKGWSAEVAFRHTRYPGINPTKEKIPPALTPGGNPSTAKHVPAETLDAFEQRLAQDVGERPDFYFDEQLIIFPTDHLAEYEQERWEVGQMIIERRARAREIGRAAFPKSSSRCWEYGGCSYIPLCTLRQGAEDLYTTVDPTIELSEEEMTDG